MHLAVVAFKTDAVCYVQSPWKE